MRFVLLFSALCAIATAGKCKGAVKCSQGSAQLGHEPNFVTYKDTAGQVYWDDNLQESLSTSCVIVVYHECSVQAFGKGDPNLVYAPPGTCALLDGKVYCECNDAHYCNIDLNRWFETAQKLYGTMNCPYLQMDWRYKQVEQCAQETASAPSPKKPDSAGQLSILMAVSGAIAANHL